jgi:multicomponent Na+:H+ antiporter subunit C
VSIAFALAGAALLALGLLGLVLQAHPLRRILAFNVLGAGVFLLFGVVARRAAPPGLGADPVPQALIITGMVVAFAATALAVALLLRLHAETGSVDLDGPADGADGRR